MRRLKGELMLAVTLPDGSRGTIAATATDILGGSEDTEQVAAVLSVDGLRRLRMLIEAKPRGPKNRGTRRRTS